MPWRGAGDIPRAPTKNRKRYVQGGIVAAGVILLTVLLGSLKPAAPSVDREVLSLDAIRRGTMVREVRGPGTLVPEHIRWISSLTPARVERIFVQPGTPVTAATALLAVQREQVGRLRAITAFRLSRLSSLQVKAGEDGVLQELKLQLGQWVVPGTILAKIVQPGKLKAVVRIPETQAAGLAIGQKASVDTRTGLVAGHVIRIDPAAQEGTVTVDIALDEALKDRKSTRLN